MSLSNPHFTTSRANYKKDMLTIMDDRAYLQLHWTEQLKLRPLRDRKPYVKAEGDYDNYIDNFDTEEREESDVT